MGVREHDLYKFLVVYIRVSAKENKNKKRNDKIYSYGTNGTVRNFGSSYNAMRGRKETPREEINLLRLSRTFVIIYTYIYRYIYIYFSRPLLSER